MLSAFQVIGSPHGRWKGLEQLPSFRKYQLLRDLPCKLRQQLGVQAEGALPVALDHVLTETGGDLIASMLKWDPNERITASAAMQHPWFEEMPRPAEGCFMPQTHGTLHSTRMVYE
jgi:cell division cycle 2-like